MNKKLIIQWYRWVSCWCEIVDGVSGVLTLGYYRPALSYKVILKSAMRQSTWAADATKWEDEDTSVKQKRKCDVGCLEFPAKVTVCFKKWKIGDSNTKVVYCSSYIPISKEEDDA